MTNTQRGKDSSDNSYSQVETENGECIRLTLVPAIRAGYKHNSLRVQIRDAKGHLRPGPELPLNIIGEILREVIDLIREPNPGSGPST